MKTSSKEGIEDYFNITNKQKNVMFSFFYTHISQFTRNVDEMFDDGNYKNSNKYDGPF